ncbi:MAG: hypothetical protein EBU85_04495 [Actinobacteria bacterium]|nr:hypothetical protein [Actinomycetota bacterium]
MSKPVVLVCETLSDATYAVLGDTVDIRFCNGADAAELLAAVPDAAALLIRSATKVTAEVIAAAPNLKVVARAGVGLDNVDVPAATAAGVMVVNAPTSNITSVAELTIGLMLAVARNIASASSVLKSGTWAKSKYSGFEIDGKTIGIVGLGRIGSLVAARLKAFGVELIAYDPFATTETATKLGVQLVPLDELLGASDYITIHLPKTPETTGIIGADALTKVKPGVRIINTSRGGLVDEVALAAAIADGRVAGAGLDVFAIEPCTDSPLFAFDQVVVTPHLGASTEEAQEKAGLSVAHSVVAALTGQEVPDAVNFTSLTAVAH